MKVSAQNPALYEAMKKVMEQSPGLISDGSRLKEIAGQLAAQGSREAALVANANPAELAEIRNALLKDVFAKTAGVDRERLTGGKALKQQKPTVVIGGGSYSGMLAAMRTAMKGVNVVMLESRPQHSRDIRLAVRQGMLDSLAAVDPELAQRVMAKASRLAPEHMFTTTMQANGRTDTRQLPNYGTEGARAPDASKLPASGAELMNSAYTHVIIARELETVIEEFMREKFGDSITVLEGALAVKPREDGNVDLLLEKSQKDGSRTTEDFLRGKKPLAVFAAEGSNSSTRRALNIATGETTPVQYWIAGVVKTVDPEVPAGEASLRVLYRNQEVTNAEGAKEIVPTRAVAISDGKEGTWLLTEMPPFMSPNPAQAQAEVNKIYCDCGSLVTGQSPEALAAAGLSGPFAKAGAVPTAFALQGRTAREASKVLPDGMVFGLLGDAVATSSFQAGGGMNTAINESDTVAALIDDLQRGVDPHQAAAKYQSEVFERGDAWSAAGIPFFYKRSSPEKTKELVALHLKAIADWRREGGDSPIKRLEAMLQQASVATEPLGPKLAA